MNKKDAKNKIINFIISEKYKINDECDYDISTDHCVDELLLSIDVNRGGMSGGNCWGNVAERYEGSSRTFSFDMVFDLFEIIAPTISFIDARIIAKDTLSSKDSSYSEYYGNYSEREEYTYNFGYTLNQLVKLGYIEEKHE